MRYRTLLITTPALATIFSLAACGDEPADDDPAAGPSGTASVRPSGTQDAETSLTIEVRASAQAPAKTWTLTCSPPGGTHPKPAEACAALGKAKDPFTPVPKDRMCTQIYGGPEVATVKGTYQGKPVDAKFTRDNGCELARWTAVAPAFGAVPPVR